MPLTVRERRWLEERGLLDDYMDPVKTYGRNPAKTLRQLMIEAAQVIYQAAVAGGRTLRPTSPEFEEILGGALIEVDVFIEWIEDGSSQITGEGVKTAARVVAKLIVRKDGDKIA